MNVTLQPNATLGRMIYSFTATAYQVLETTIDNMNEFGIIDVGEFTSLATDDITLSFGQIRGVYYDNSDIYGAIRQQEEISVAGGYKMSLKRVKAIWVEQYPPIDFTGIILELEAKRAEALNNGESALEIQETIDEYKRIEARLKGPLATAAILSVNGTEVVVAPNKVYQLKEFVTSLTLVRTKVPIIVNYICELTQKEDESIGVISSIDASRIWGQVSGVFTGTDKVLRQYDYTYKRSPTYRIYNPYPVANAWSYDAQGNVLVDSTNYNVYKETNILDVIKQETQRQVEFIYNTRFDRVDEDGVLNDGLWYYEFNELTLFDIEADEGTVLRVGRLADGSDAVDIRIGPTGRYVLTPLAGEVGYLALRSPQFCVINYKCLTNQMKKIRQGG